MGFWDKLKDFFIGTGASTPVADWSAVEARLRAHMNVRAKAGHAFTAHDAAAAATGLKPNAQSPVLDEAARRALNLVQTGLLSPFNYVITQREVNGRATWVFHAMGSAPNPDFSAAGGDTVGLRGGGAGTSSAAGVSRQRPTAKGGGAAAYQAGEVLGMSVEEFRSRALRITPWRTPWIGRTDIIPPASDERTRLIDQGLMMGGYLNAAELAEIHRIGDLWLRHKDAFRMAASKAHATADEALEARKKERAEAKAQKKKDALAREEERRKAVAHKKATDITFVGHGVSGKLNDRRSHVEKLQAAGLPVLSAPADLATAIGISIKDLRWLCFHAEAADRVHYVSFEIPKRSGGVRLISAPHQKMEAAQRWVLENILQKLKTEDEAHGFVSGRSTVTNARPHVKKAVVINLDIKDFFPTITVHRIRGIFETLGYSPAVATLLALLCTESPRRPITYAGKTLHVAVGPRALPQGACTSPALSNQVARTVDRRLRGRAKVLGFGYTRYADDLTFSSENVAGNVGKVMAMVRHVLDEEGFTVHPDKGAVHRRAGQQLVTGIVVNDKPAVPRAELKRLRAILHAAQKTGLSAQNRENIPNFEAYLRGKIAYVAMVDRAKAFKLQAELDSAPE